MAHSTLSSSTADDGLPAAALMPTSLPAKLVAEFFVAFVKNRFIVQPRGVRGVRGDYANSRTFPSRFGNSLKRYREECVYDHTHGRDVVIVDVIECGCGVVCLVFSDI